jgi:hypothetical protein
MLGQQLPRRSEAQAEKSHLFKARHAFTEIPSRNCKLESFSQHSGLCGELFQGIVALLTPNPDPCSV